MHTIAAHEIPHLYSAYCISAGRWYEDGKLVMGNQYYCNKCRSKFTVGFKYSGMMGNYDGFNDSLVYCPHCGERHEDWWGKRRTIHTFPDTDKDAPVNISLQVREGKNILVLKARMKVFQFRERGEEVMHPHLFKTRIEEFRFDIKNRRTELIIRAHKGTVISERYELGDPLNAPLFKASLLSHICSDNLSRDYGKGASEIIKVLRDRMRKKWQEIHGYDIGSLYVSYGKTHGRMLFPLLNMAYRLVFVDAGNLPRWLSGPRYQVENEMASRLLDDSKCFADLATVRNSQDTVSAVVKAFKLPDKPFIRRILTGDIFAASELSAIYKITQDTNRVEAIWQAMHGEVVDRYANKGVFLKITYSLMQELVEHYSETQVLNFVKTRPSEIVDTYHMLQRLVPGRKEALWKLKPKELHNGLVQALKHQREEGFGLAVPEHIRKRLSMQMDQLRFYLPEHSKELMQIGDALHNCVRTYDERMLAGQSYIVPVTDDKGKLVACLEVKKNKLVQAKLKYNRPVRDDAGLNREVLAWAEKAGLKVETSDVRESLQLREVI